MVLVIYQILDLLLTVARWIIILQFIVSLLITFNVINTYNDFVRTVTMALDRMTEPLYRPIRRILPDFGGLDFSPMIVLLLLIIMQDIILPAIFRPLLLPAA